MAQTMTEKLEATILRNLISCEAFYRKVVPFLKAEYFEDMSDRVIFEEINDFSTKYDKMPTSEVVILQLQQRNDLTEETYQTSVKQVKEFTDEPVDTDWLRDRTEKWCQERAIYNALLRSIKIADGGDKEVSRDAILSLIHI